MKKKLLLNVLLFGCMVFLAACGKEEPRETPKDDVPAWDSEDIPQHITETITDNITIDADVTVLPGFEKGKADIYKVKLGGMERELAKELLTENNPAVSSETETYGEGDRERIIDQHVLENGDTLRVYDSYLNYDSELARNIFYCIRFLLGESGNNEEVFAQNTEDFGFMTLEEAEKEGVQLLEKLGIGKVETYRSFRLAHETLAAEEDVIIDPGLEEKYWDKPREAWTDRDDCYYFEFYPQVNGYAFIMDGYSPETETVRTVSPYEMIYNCDGIVELLIPNMFTLEETLKEQEPLINAQEAVDVIKKNYGQVIVKDSVIDITDICLGNVLLFQEEYGVYETVPVWAFMVIETRELEEEEMDQIELTSMRLVNAVTGKEIR